MSSPAAGPEVQKRTMNGVVLAVAVAVATIGMIAVNGLANALPINGQGTGEVTLRYDVYFIPAGYAFSIWSLIYLGLIGYTVYLVWAVFGHRSADAALAIVPWYLLTAVANAGWLLAWHYNQFPLSMLLMVVLLVALIVIYRMLAVRPAASRLELWTVHIPFRVYLGWISVATIANATITLDDAGWNGFGIAEPTWGVIMILVATALGLVMSFMYSDIAYAAVIVWALVAVAIRLSDTASIFVTALAGAVLLTGVAVVTALRRRRVPAKVMV